MRARPLEQTTWPDFAQLVERHNGVWGGCWCMGFHEEGFAGPNRENKDSVAASVIAFRLRFWCGQERGPCSRRQALSPYSCSVSKMRYFPRAIPMAS